MKKVYLVRALLKEGAKRSSSITEIFTNKSKAKAFCDFFNSKEETKFYYYVEERTICEFDYRGIPF